MANVLKRDRSLKVSFKTFGCRSNFADTVDLASLVSEKGAWVSEFSSDEESDVIVINSCTVTDSADKEAVKLVRKLKEEQPDARIVLTGCLAEAKPDVFSEAFPDIEVLGPGQKKNVLNAILGEHQRDTRTQVRESLSPERIRKPSHKTISLDDPMSSALVGPGGRMGAFKVRSRFHLRVQEGCENHCTFCIIPKTRGVLSSRELKEVLGDIDVLAGLGYQEIVLTGTHLGGYGEDKGLSLLLLLKEIEEHIHRSSYEKRLRIRLSSLDPDDVSFEMIDFLSKSHIYCSHLHICLQAFTDSTLKRMNRKYRLEDATDLLWYIQERFDGCAVGSDIITGFPGESRKELEEGMETFLSLPISYLHVFPYSEREGTAATRLDSEVPVSERKRRSARWRALAERRRVEFLSTLIGKDLEIILEDRVLDDGSVLGTSSEYAEVRVVNVSEASSGTVSKSDVTGLPSGMKPVLNDLQAGSLIQAKAVLLETEERRLICELSDQAN